jgi:putative ABC transport system substrate-binding protein
MLSLEHHEVGMRRRDFIKAIAGSALAWPLPARAQQPAMPVVGLISGSFMEHGGRLAAFRQGLSETGFVEGRNVLIEYRIVNNERDQLLMLAGELANRPVNVLAAAGIPAALAAKETTTVIPIAFFVAGDPVKLGLVTSLNRPGGNLTGTTSLGAELSQKRVELARELFPMANTIGLLVNPTNPNTEAILRDVWTAVRRFGLNLDVLHASTPGDIDTSFAMLAQRRVGVLVVGNDGLFIGQTDKLAALSIRYAVSTIFQTPEFAAAGGLMSYGASNKDAFRQFGSYTGRILRGENPRDLPIVQSTKIELIVNLKTAKALGVTVPPTLLARADEVIE